MHRCDVERVVGATRNGGSGEEPAGDDRAVVEVYEREHDAMVRLARLMVGSQVVAEELVHDAFVTVMERQGEIEDLGAYLRTVVVNNCNGFSRRSLLGRAKVAELRERDRGRLELAPELDEMWSALDRLQQRQRTALVLRFYADLTIDQIAEVMGEPAGTVKSLIHRGITRLRGELTR